MAGQEQNLNEMLVIKREKLQKLRDEGRDPFVIEKYNVDAYSTDIKDNYAEYEGKKSFNSRQNYVQERTRKNCIFRFARL